MPRQLGHGAQQVIAHHLHVWTHPRQQHSERSSIQHSKRMVGHHHDRAADGNSRRIRRIHAQSYPHLRQQVLKAETRGGLLYPSV